MGSTNVQLAIDKMAKTNSRVIKVHILRECKEGMRYFKAAYNPYINFNIRPSDSLITDVGTCEFDNQTWHSLNVLAKGLRGRAATTLVQDELKRLEPLSQRLYLNILRRDLRCGISAKTINKVFPGLIPEFPVQLASLYKGDMRFPVLGSYKIDGLRCLYKEGVLYSRYGRPFVGLDKLANFLRESKAPDLDGELTVPGRTFDELSGEIRSFKPTDNVVYNVFDLYETSPLYERLTLLNMWYANNRNPMISMVLHRTLVNDREVDEMYTEAREGGYEGLVLKKEDGLPFNGRNKDWQKVKPKDTIDLEVLDVEEGEGKYQDCTGALVCDNNGVIIHIGGGMTDSQRIKWWRDPNLIIGKTIEIEYMEVSSYGALRHPRLKTVRSDK